MMKGSYEVTSGTPLCILGLARVLSQAMVSAGTNERKSHDLRKRLLYPASGCKGTYQVRREDQRKP